jgi:hypothetical protein
MNTFKFAALAAALLMQSLAHPANTPSHESVSGNPVSVSLDSANHTVAHGEESRDYFLIPDMNDLHGVACDPEDDCPRR